MTKVLGAGAEVRLRRNSTSVLSGSWLEATLAEAKVVAVMSEEAVAISPPMRVRASTRRMGSVPAGGSKSRLRMSFTFPATPLRPTLKVCANSFWMRVSPSAR
jgi:hypothetical protein